jgi:hypothetical protein
MNVQYVSKKSSLAGNYANGWVVRYLRRHFLLDGHTRSLAWFVYRRPDLSRCHPPMCHPPTTGIWRCREISELLDHLKGI